MLLFSEKMKLEDKGVNRKDSGESSARRQDKEIPDKNVSKLDLFLSLLESRVVFFVFFVCCVMSVAYNTKNRVCLICIVLQCRNT